ncbi:MAG: selenium cofactor biosynthesis protein YqeC [Desulfopila sp.]
MIVTDQPDFLGALGLGRGDVVSIVGAGGKTTLMFRLATEARALGLRVLVTTSTRIFIPDRGAYDRIDLSGALFAGKRLDEPGIYVGGRLGHGPGKVGGVDDDLLIRQKKHFDLVLIEADGSAGRPLKGWRQYEPVVHAATTVTVGIVDIQTIGCPVDERMVHRMEIFCRLTGARPGDAISADHLLQLIDHRQGLFAKARGRRILYINKVESIDQQRLSESLCGNLPHLATVCGSLARGCLDDQSAGQHSRR